MTGATPTISVLMGAYNPPSGYLDAAVSSILGQTYRDFEFVIVDDGSDEGTRARLRDHAVRDGRVRLTPLETNVGLTRALNNGLAIAQGKYVARQDADDVSHPERLEILYHFLESNPDVAAVGTNAEIIDRRGRKLGATHIDPCLRALTRRNVLIHGSMMFRKEVLDRLGGYNETMRLSQDYELYLRMTRLHGLKIGVVEKELYSLRQHSGTLSSRKILRQLYYAVLAKTLTLPQNVAAWRRKLFFGAEFLRDLIVTHRFLLGPLTRRYRDRWTEQSSER